MDRIFEVRASNLTDAIAQAKARMMRHEERVWKISTGGGQEGTNGY
jgi:hypothetical protein